MSQKLSLAAKQTPSSQIVLSNHCEMRRRSIVIKWASVLTLTHKLRPVDSPHRLIVFAFAARPKHTVSSIIAQVLACYILKKAD